MAQAQPEPYTAGEGDSYSFPVELFPTKDDVVAWFVRTDGLASFTDYWTVDDIGGPIEQLVHDHDEDFTDCTHDDQCPESKRLDCWWISG